jgi:hypothetical protein
VATPVLTNSAGPFGQTQKLLKKKTKRKKGIINLLIKLLKEGNT